MYKLCKCRNVRTHQGQQQQQQENKRNTSEGHEAHTIKCMFQLARIGNSNRTFREKENKENRRRTSRIAITNICYIYIHVFCIYIEKIRCIIRCSVQCQILSCTVLYCLCSNCTNSRKSRSENRGQVRKLNEMPIDGKIVWYCMVHNTYICTHIATFVLFRATSEPNN